jgi:hypothetical protein
MGLLVCMVVMLLLPKDRTSIAPIVTPPPWTNTPPTR